ncbi:MAG: hypothetical protein ACYTG6_03295 [Planctomycetota bacterium]
MTTGRSENGELLRPLLHAATGSCALVLGVVSHPVAIACALLGILAGWVVLPSTPLDRRLRRPGEPFVAGLRTYPIAVLGLVAFLPAAEAAAAWAVLAFGDAAAAVAGNRLRAPAVFGHPTATWAGTAALLVVGTLTAWGMGGAVAGLAAATGAVDTGAAPGLVRCLAAAAVAALVDLVPIPPDDNLPCAVGAGAALALTREVLV